MPTTATCTARRHPSRTPSLLYVRKRIQSPYEVQRSADAAAPSAPITVCSAIGQLVGKAEKRTRQVHVHYMDGDDRKDSIVQGGTRGGVLRATMRPTPAIRLRRTIARPSRRSAASAVHEDRPYRTRRCKGHTICFTLHPGNEIHSTSSEERLRGSKQDARGSALKARSTIRRVALYVTSISPRPRCCRCPAVIAQVVRLLRTTVLETFLEATPTTSAAATTTEASPGAALLWLRRWPGRDWQGRLASSVWRGEAPCRQCSGEGRRKPPCLTRKTLNRECSAGYFHGSDGAVENLVRRRRIRASGSIVRIPAASVGLQRRGSRQLLLALTSGSTGCESDFGS